MKLLCRTNGRICRPLASLRRFILIGSSHSQPTLHQRFSPRHGYACPMSCCKNYRSDNGRDAHARRRLQFLPNLYGLGFWNLIGILNDKRSDATVIRSLQVLVENWKRWCHILDVENFVSCQLVPLPPPGTRKSRLPWFLVPGTLPTYQGLWCAGRASKGSCRQHTRIRRAP